MAIVDLNLQPTHSQLRWFGLLMLTFFLILGGVFRYFNPGDAISSILWAIGVAVALVYYLVAPLRVLIYKLWMYLFFPIGWTISNLIFLFIYFVVLTPIGLLIKILHTDTLRKRYPARLASYWKRRENVEDVARYFKQF